MMTLFRQHRKYYNRNNTIFNLVLHMALPQVALLVGTTKPLSYVPGSSAGYAQPLTADNFEIISNLEKILVRVRYA